MPPAALQRARSDLQPQLARHAVVARARQRHGAQHVHARAQRVLQPARAEAARYGAQRRGRSARCGSRRRGGARLWLMERPLEPAEEETPGVASTVKPA